MTGPGSATPFGDESMALEEVAAGAAGGPFPGGVLSGENTQQLLGTPGGMTMTRLEQGLHDNGGGFVRAGVRSAGLVAQPLEPVDLIAGGPLVGGLATDAEARAARKLGRGVVGSRR